MRQLATIQTIKAINEIPNADSIEVATVLGWHVVIKKDEYKVGDKVIYVEIDSILPAREEYSFLEEKKYRIRTVKLRGQVSQGICFPLGLLPSGVYDVGTEVTDILGIVKYEPPIPACLNGEVKGQFPIFIPKTDENRVQVLVDDLIKYSGRRFVVSEKIDGTSSTFYLNDSEFGACSKVLDLFEDDRNTYWQMVRKYNIKENLIKLNRNLALQGEVIGDGIQSNKYRLEKNERKLYLFNIFDIDTQSYLDYEEFIEIAKILELDTVPFIDIDFEFESDVDKLVELSKGNSELNEKTKREGIVLKLYEDINHLGNKVSFKVINPEFLIKYKE